MRLLRNTTKVLSELENSSRDIDSCLLVNKKLKAKIDSLSRNDMKNLITQYRSVFHMIQI